LVELFSQDMRTIVRVSTDEEGYFFLPNIPSGVYDVAQVSIGNIAVIGWRGSYMTTVERFVIPAGMLVFSPVPGKVGYAGGIFVDVDERGVGTASEASDDAGAREYFLRNVAKSPWAVREMISLRSRPAARPISHF
jgi:hypothetical protein